VGLVLISSLLAVLIVINLAVWYSDYLENQSLKSSENGDQVSSLHLAEKAADYNPLSISAMFVLAGAQQRIGRSVEARNTLLRATAEQPDNYLTWTQLALYERDQWGMPDEARSHFQKALSLNPFDPLVKESLGID
jgi:Flp pilus assembly protein TadD